MTDATIAPLELVHDSGNVCRDLGYPDDNERQRKALLAALIINPLNRQGLWIA